jgi:AcrR family transcriptional regulator
MKSPAQTRDARSRILDAAVDVFARRGVDAASAQEIADRAGVDDTLLRCHFPSKTDLAHAVWLRIASSFVPRILHMMASDLSIDKKSRRLWTITAPADHENTRRRG